MYRWFRFIVASLWITFGVIPPTEAHTDDFVIGVAPHTSARVIISMYQPLRLHLEAALGRPVVIVTAPNFTDTAQRALDQKYDLVITTGHQSRMLQTDAGYMPLVTYQAEFYAVALVAKNYDFQSPQQLKSGRIMGLSETSLVTLWGMHWLKDNGLPDANVSFVSASDSVARLITGGNADIGFMSLANFQQLSPDVQSELKIVAQSQSLAGRIYMLNKRNKNFYAKIDHALMDLAKSRKGKEYFSKYQLGGYRKLRPNELAEMDRYADEVRRELKLAKH